MGNDTIPLCNSAAKKILDYWLAQQQIRRRIPGISVGITNEQQTTYQNFLGSKNSKGSRADETTLFRIASISKIFTTISLLQLKEQKKLNLDDPVAEYLEWFRDETDKNKEVITIRQILYHCSGLSRDGKTTHWSEHSFPDKDSLKKSVRESRTTREPIVRMNYSNLAFGVLGQVIEAVTNQAYDQYVDKNILKKLGMENTFADYTEDQKDSLAKGFSREDEQGIRTEFDHLKTYALASATGFSSCIKDICTFMRAQLSMDKRLLSKESWRDMKRIQWIHKSGTKYGLGYWLYDTAGCKMYGHSGGFQGFISMMGLNDEHKTGIVVLTNAIDGPAIELANTMMAILRKTEETSEKKEEDLKEYEGVYESVWGEIQIVNINHELISTMPLQRNPVAETTTFEKKEKDVFLMKEGNEFDYVGEDAIFQRDEQQKITGVRIGPDLFNKKEIKES